MILQGTVASTPPRAQASCATVEPPDLHDDENSLKRKEGKGRGHAPPDGGRPPSVAAAASETLDGRAPPPPLSQQCPVCFITYFTISDLRKHFKQLHSDVKFVKCILCSKQMLGNFDVFLAHRKSHQCGAGTAAGRGAKTLECRVCHKQIRASGYSHHLTTHKQVPCPICNNLVSHRNLKRHINYFHTKARIYACDACPAVYHDPSHLLSHRKRNHMGQEVRRHLCEVCGKKFIAPSDLRTHVAGVHHNVKKFVCEYCGLSFKVSSALKYHHRLHTGEKPHACHVCEKSFMKPSALAKHVRCVHGLEYHGKYRKRTKPQEPSSKRSPSQGSSNSVAPKCEGAHVTTGSPFLEEEGSCRSSMSPKCEGVTTGSTFLEEEGSGRSSMSPTLKEATQQEAEGEALRVAAVYCEGGVVQVVDLHTQQPIQNVTYFRPATEDRAVARPYEATAPLHTLSYYRQDAADQYTVAELLPPQNHQEAARPYPGTAPSPVPSQPH